MRKNIGIIVGTSIEGPIGQRITPIIDILDEKFTFDIYSSEDGLTSNKTRYTKIWKNIVTVNPTGKKIVKTWKLPYIILYNVLAVLKWDHRKHHKVHVYKATIIILLPLILKTYFSGSFRRKLITDIDDYESYFLFPKSSLLRKLYDFFENLLIRRSSAVTTNTQFSYKRVTKLNKKALYIPNVVSKKEEVTGSRKDSKKSENILKLIYFGSVDATSGHDVKLILESLERLGHNNYTFDIYGKGKSIEDLRSYIRQSQSLADRVKVHGTVAHDLLMKLLPEYDLSFDPSINTLVNQARYPLKIVEAHSKGLPVLTFNVGDRKIIVDPLLCIETTGLNSREDYITALSNRLDKIFTGKIDLSNVKLRYPKSEEYKIKLSEIYEE